MHTVNTVLPLSSSSGITQKSFLNGNHVISFTCADNLETRSFSWGQLPGRCLAVLMTSLVKVLKFTAFGLYQTLFNG